MSIVTPNMSLNVWNSLTDEYDHSQLASNFIKLDQHDHSPGSGAQINGATGIKDASIPSNKLASDLALSYKPNSIPITAVSVTSGSIAGNAITTGTITNTQLGAASVQKEELKSIPYLTIGRTGAITNVVNSNASYSLFGFAAGQYTENTSATGDLSMADATNNQIVIRRAGVYAMRYSIEQTLSTITFCSTYIQKNGTSGTYLARGYATNDYAGGDHWYATSSVITYLGVGETIKSYYRIPIGSTPSTSNSATQYFDIAWLGNYSNYS